MAGRRDTAATGEPGSDTPGTDCGYHPVIPFAAPNPHRFPTVNPTVPPSFFPEASAFHTLFNRADWAATPLGAPDGWPASLRANVGLLLDARIAMGIVWGPGRCLLYNEAYVGLLGEKHPWALGRPLNEVWAEIWPQLAPLVEAAYAGEARDVQDFLLEIRRGGRLEPGWFTIFCSPLRDDAGVVRGLSSTVIESTARIRAELAVRDLNRTLDARVAERTAEMQRREAHLASLFNQTAAGIAETDLTTRIVRANDTLCRILGRARSDVIGRNAIDLVHPDDLAANRAALAEVVRTGRPTEIENRFVRPDGGTVWVSKIVSAIVEPGAGVETGAPASLLAVVVDITARREAEARLRDSAERLQLATMAADLGIWSWDAATDKATYENDRMYDIVGVPHGSEPVNLARFLADFVHPDDAEAYRAAIRASFDGDRPFHIECRFRRGHDRAPRWFESIGRMVRDAGGKPLHMVGTAADITDRKTVLDQLRAAQGRLEATLNAGEIGTWLFDLRTDRLQGDANMARLNGVSDERAAAGDVAAYFANIEPDDLQVLRASMAAARAHGTPYRGIYRTRMADGSRRVLHTRGTPEFEGGKPVRLAGVVIDITQQTEMETRLRVREQRYRTLISSIDEGFAIVELIYDPEGHAVDHRFLEVNPAYERHTGVVDATGRTALQIAPDIEPDWHTLYAQVAASGEAVRALKYAKPLDRWFDVHVARLQDEAHKVALVFRDVTAQRRADAELRQLADDLADANRRQNDFLATLAHELRNPLAPIRTGLELMRMNPDNAATGARVRGMMERQVNHLIHLVNDLLDLARIQSGKIELKPVPVVLQDIVSEAVDAVRPLVETRRHALDLAMPDAPIALDADPNRLVQVLVNLLTNAAKYTPEGGHVGLTLRVEGGDAVLEVRDDGIGIPAEALPSLFEMFSQARHGSQYAQGGLGIGLSLVKRLVEQHGGSVAAASEGPGRGSRFTLRLPAASAPASKPSPLPGSPASAPPPGAAARTPLRILIADDNADAAELLAASLQLDGHRVEIVHDGRAALAAVAAAPFDLALLDIGMPGMTGYELAEAIGRDPALARPVLAAVTGWGTEEDRERARRAGFEHHLTKPVDLGSIAAIVAGIVPAHRSDR